MAESSSPAGQTTAPSVKKCTPHTHTHLWIHEGNSTPLLCLILQPFTQQCFSCSNYAALTAVVRNNRKALPTPSTDQSRVRRLQHSMASFNTSSPAKTRFCKDSLPLSSPTESRLIARLDAKLWRRPAGRQRVYLAVKQHSGCP